MTDLTLLRLDDDLCAIDSDSPVGTAGPEASLKLRARIAPIMSSVHFTICADDNKHTQNVCVQEVNISMVQSVSAP